MTREPLLEQARAVTHPACKPLVNELVAEIERLRATLRAIERHTAPSTRTWDTCLRDMGLANDEVRAALEPKP